MSEKEKSTPTQPDVPAFEIAVRTDPGRDPDKQVNEDSSAFVETSLGLLCVVCDGMGGHAGGKEASELAVKTIVEMVQAAPPGSLAGDVLRAALTEANSRIWNMPTAEAGLRPGSTVVVALLHDHGADIAHVGDSRVYLVHAGAISQVTSDHSMVQELVNRNLIKAEDAAKHPDANKILRALGIAKDVEVEVRPEPIAYVAGDVFVLCSDGLSDLVTPAEILEVAASDSPPQAAGRLVDLANARGGHDNITALVLRTKTSARANTAPMMMKTMPLTAAPVPVPVAQARGSGETVLEAPLGAKPAPPAAVSAPTLQSPVHPGQQQSAAAAPAPQVAVVTPAAIPPPPEPTSVRSPDRARTGAFIGLALAVIGLVMLGLFWLNRREDHKNVPVIDLPPKEAGPMLVDDDNDPNTPPVIVSVAPLAPPPPSTPRKWDGVRSPDPCVGAGRARANGAPQNVIDRLEAQCRADGGTPIPFVAPVATPAPTPTPTPPSTTTR
jgi:PPM family protein phosphatase